ncbi:MAG: DUF2974 domain-containing protein [Oscillospiraceae bacterium]|nr:DUF2974 domain-containing protein [Oscillospiraceae bacterium]
MANMIDYLDWRGDISLRHSPFNEVDNLILSNLSYGRFGGIVPSPAESGLCLLPAAAAAHAANGPYEVLKFDALSPEYLPRMLEKMAKCPRFATAALSDFVACTDLTVEMQFAALTVHLEDGTIFVSFRGTDDSLVGWKEDFNLSFMDTVPSQKEAVRYLEAVAAKYPRRPILVGGHSKGGHLAVYAAVNARKSVRKRIRQVYNNDGPGFNADFYTQEGYIELDKSIITLVPESSVVGMLMEHDNDYQVVRSTDKGLWQHVAFGWEVLGTAFVPEEEADPDAKVYNQTIREWLAAMTHEQRHDFIEAVYALLTAGGDIDDLQDFKVEKTKSAVSLVKSFGAMDKTTRKVLFDMMELLAKQSVKVVKSELNLRQKLEKILER